MASDQCSFAGNSDLYGLGIRIGVYTQILSTVVTNHFLPADVAGTSTANLIFLCALLLAVIRAVSTNIDFYAVECFVILQLILTFFFASTEGVLFLLAELFTAFLDGHIPVAVLKRLVAEESVSGLHVSRYLSKLGQAYAEETPLRATAQRCLSLAASIVNFWFWTAGVPKLKRAAAGCPTYVFFFSPVVLGTPIRAVFISLSALYLSRHGLVFLVSLNVSSNASWRDWLQETFDPRSNHERSIQEASDDAAEDILRRAKQTKRSPLSARLLRGLHVVLLSWSSCVMCYSILAVEITLAWNNVQGIYEVSSTGQFIPLLIGILGLGRALVSAFITHPVPSRRVRISQVSTKAKNTRLTVAQSRIDKSTIQTEQESAKFQYRVGRRRKIVFDANRPSRRNSLGALDSQRAAPRITKFSRRYPLVPVVPGRPSVEDVRPRIPLVEPNSGRFVLADRKGGYHVFHDHRLGRRLSWDGVTEVAFSWGNPHRGRQALWTPLKMREQAEEAEDDRERWFEWRTKRLRRHVASSLERDGRPLDRWKRFRGRTNDEDAAFGPENGIPPWLPADVDDQRVFCKRPDSPRMFPRTRRSSTASSISSPSSTSLQYMRSDSPRPQSPGVGDIFPQLFRPGSVYSRFGGYTFGGSAPCLLTPGSQDRGDDEFSFTTEISSRNSIFVAEPSDVESTVYEPRSRSASLRDSTSFPPPADSVRSGSQSAAPSVQEGMSLFKRMIIWLLVPVIVIFNAFCLCGLFSGCLRGARKLKRSKENMQMERRMRRQKPTVPTLRNSLLYHCSTCDRDFEQERRTRQWQRIRAATPHRRSESEISGFVRWVQNPLHLLRRRLRFLGPAYTKRVLSTVAMSVFSLLRRLAFVDELLRAIKTRAAAYEIEMEDFDLDASGDSDNMV